MEDERGAELQNSQKACGEKIEHHNQTFYLYQLEYWMSKDILETLRDTKVSVIQIFRQEEHLAFQADKDLVQSFIARNYQCIFPE